MCYSVWAVSNLIGIQNDTYEILEYLRDPKIKSSIIKQYEKKLKGNLYHKDLYLKTSDLCPTEWWADVTMQWCILEKDLKSLNAFSEDFSFENLLDDNAQKVFNMSHAERKANASKRMQEKLNLNIDTPWFKITTTESWMNKKKYTIKQFWDKYAVEPFKKLSQNFSSNSVEWTINKDKESIKIAKVKEINNYLETISHKYHTTAFATVNLEQSINSFKMNVDYLLYPTKKKVDSLYDFNEALFKRESSGNATCSVDLNHKK